MAFGLTDVQVERISSVFAASPKIRRVRVFGSRALGREREGSDIDLAVEGEGLTFDDLQKLRIALGDLPMLHRFDVVDVATITEPALRDHIERVGRPLFVRSP